MAAQAAQRSQSAPSAERSSWGLADELAGIISFVRAPQLSPEGLGFHQEVRWNGSSKRGEQMVDAGKGNGTYTSL
eukprot:CAMPEP_0195119970 /NCGR_PEP_ID=MMETSP0448-20130528/120767_1 /TAXON_ID=66468 /ORGANISM="Heterocapsa triquestra, Strain CCMP 448" /LENGTH=74 /DNA_ID=CAMNT_0040157359 /DNA_START=1 /DNA_END=222 /DNA_ORIENTATION=+